MLGGDSKSHYKWIMLDRHVYPAYTTIELLQRLPEEYVLGRSDDKWYCKDSTDSWDEVVYYTNPAEACAHCYINMLKEKEGNTI